MLSEGIVGQVLSLRPSVISAASTRELHYFFLAEKHTIKLERKKPEVWCFLRQNSNKKVFEIVH